MMIEEGGEATADSTLMEIFVVEPSRQEHRSLHKSLTRNSQEVKRVPGILQTPSLASKIVLLSFSFKSLRRYQC